MPALWILLGVSVLLVLIMVLPLRICLRYRSDGGFSYRVKYLFIPLADSERTPAPRRAKPKKARASAPPAKKSDGGTVRKLLSFLGLDEISSAADFKKAVGTRGLLDVIGSVTAQLRSLLSHSGALLRKGVFTRFSLRILVGDEDPAEAAFGYGRLCAAVYPLVSLLSSVMTLRRPEVDIRFDDSRTETCAEFDACLQYRPWHFVCFLFYLIGNYIKSQKGANQDE